MAIGVKVIVVRRIGQMLRHGRAGAGGLSPALRQPQSKGEDESSQHDEVGLLRNGLVSFGRVGKHAREEKDLLGQGQRQDSYGRASSATAHIPRRYADLGLEILVDDQQ